MPFPLPVPNILGHYWSFGSIELVVVTPRGPVRIVDCVGINYAPSMEVGDVYGTLPQKLGTTRGKQNAEGSLELNMRAWEALRTALGVGGIGYSETRFQIIVSYGEAGTPVKTDILEGCRIVRVEYSNADGTEASKVSLTLNVMRIVEGGTSMIAAPLRIGF
jgi:hypothetical protein